MSEARKNRAELARATREKIKALPAGGRITSQMLKDAGACLGQRRRFAKVFPKGMRLRRDDILKALGSGLSVAWLHGVMDLPDIEGTIEMALDRRVDADQFRRGGVVTVDWAVTCAFGLLIRFPR